MSNLMRSLMNRVSNADKINEGSDFQAKFRVQDKDAEKVSNLFMNAGIEYGLDMDDGSGFTVYHVDEGHKDWVISMFTDNDIRYDYSLKG